MAIRVPPTVSDDPALPFAQIHGYRFHVRTYGDRSAPPLIVIHGGPGGDSHYLEPIKALSASHHLIFYDQRGTGLSPRVDGATLTLESSLEDLHHLVNHFAGSRPVKLLGHSWGAMLAIGYLARHPDSVSHAVAVEPGMLHPVSAQAFVRRLKASQSVFNAVPMLGYIALSALVRSRDGHERFDYVMTRMMNRASPGGPYQCPEQTMPANAFVRAGYAAFANMLKPVLDRPERFTHDLTQGASAYQGRLLMLSSACSFIGYAYQQEFHLPLLPKQTLHLEAKAMGHNMLTLNPQWSVTVLSEFLGTA